MLHSDIHRLEQRIIHLLAEHPGASASWLHAECSTRFGPCSIQGIYYELRKLQKAGSVVKVGDTFSLSLSWAFELVNFADVIYDRYISSASSLEIIPEAQSSRTWKFTNLLRLDDLWVQTMIALFEHTGCKQKFAWTPHPWFYFAQVGKVNQFYKLFHQRGWKYYATIGGTTFLDTHYAQQMDTRFFEYRIGEAPVFGNMSQHHGIIGDYLITVKLDSATTARIEELFQSIHCLADAHYQRVAEVLNTKGKLTLKVEHNPKKVGAYTRKFKNYFGA